MDDERICDAVHQAGIPILETAMAIALELTMADSQQAVATMTGKTDASSPGRTDITNAVSASDIGTTTKRRSRAGVFTELDLDAKMLSWAIVGEKSE